MRHTNLILYNRYTKDDSGKTVKKDKEVKLTRALCLYDILINPTVSKDDKGKEIKKMRFTDFDSFIIQSDKLYCEKNDKDSNIPETFRIWRIICPVLIACGVDVPDYLQ
jgi:hypothetical protein